MLAFGLVAGTAMAQYQMAPAGAPPQTLPAPVAAALEAHGFQISAPGGKVYCQIWPAKSFATGKNTEEGVTLPTIAHGALLGVVEFPANGADRRGNTIKPGIYSMRYSLYPADGNHMGVAPQRDFVVLIPVAQDSAPDAVPSYDELIALSRKTTGLPHPAVLSLYPSSLETLPGFQKEGDHDWVLHVKINGVAIAIIVVGKAEG
ncbi:MAG TPA: hypothetical protein VG672_11490 [Bryobacteraceae bacterium]|nr:hypothetical protein [Bryobacteraceae bacterium]